MFRYWVEKFWAASEKNEKELTFNELPPIKVGEIGVNQISYFQTKLEKELRKFKTNLTNLEWRYYFFIQGSFFLPNLFIFIGFGIWSGKFWFAKDLGLQRMDWCLWNLWQNWQVKNHVRFAMSFCSKLTPVDCRKVSFPQHWLVSDDQKYFYKKKTFRFKKISTIKYLNLKSIVTGWDKVESSPVA